MFERLKRFIPDPGPHPKARLWLGLAVTGFVAMMIFGAISLLQPLLYQTAAAGDPLPEAAVTNLEGETMRLTEAARGRDEMVVMSPSCDVCTGELRARIATIEGAPGSFPERLEGTLILLIRQPVIPRAGFMEGLRDAQRLGAEVVRISQETARKLGVRRVPSVIDIRSGRMGEVRSWDRTQGGIPRS